MGNASDIICKTFLDSFKGCEDKYPSKLKSQFPRILNNIVLLWGSQNIEACFNDLLIDDRGGRQGFPPEILSEILNLQIIHDRLFPKVVEADPWDAIENSIDFDIVSDAVKTAIKINKSPITVSQKKNVKKHEGGITCAEQLWNALNKKSPPQIGLKLGEVLIHEGIVTQEQMDEALACQDKDHIGKRLVRLGYATEEEVERIAAKRLGFTFVNLAFFKIEPDATTLVSKELAIKYQIIPLCTLDNRLAIAIENPITFNDLDFLTFKTGKTIVLVGATKKHIQSRLDNYGENKSIENAQVDLQYFTGSIEDEKSEAVEINEDADISIDANEIDVADNAVVKIVNKMIGDAYDQGASDIHLESKMDTKTLLIRFRKDGNLYTYYTLPPKFRNSVISRIKIMCQLNITERRRPQDGKIIFNYPGKGRLELRVATIPTAGGAEDVVMRLLAAEDVTPMVKINLNEQNYYKLKKIITRPHGILLICGPTGSGKTTTLHSLMHEISNPKIKIWTVEDPVEINQDHLCQVQVNDKIGLDFATIIRSFLRADPDVIMIGEMRDRETCKAALEASLTGHLVLSTLHTNSASESVIRLLEMGMDPFNFADAMLGVLAQRLARKLCDECKIEYTATDEELLELAEEYSFIYSIESKHHRKDYIAIIDYWKERFSGSGGISLFRSNGCEHCNNTGYKGRFGIHELIITSPEIKALIRHRAPVPDILLQSLTEGTLTLKQDGIEKVLQGITTMHEVRAACV